MRRLMDDPDIRSGWNDIEQQFVREWRNCPDPEQRENLWRALKVMEKLEVFMRSASVSDVTPIKRVGLPGRK